MVAERFYNKLLGIKGGKSYSWQIIVQQRVINIIIYFAFGNGLRADEEQNKIKCLLIRKY